MSNLKGIIIDPGHGGVDVGATANNTYEKDLTLLISKYMYELFKNYGIKVYLTRDIDETLSPSKRVNTAKNFLGTSKDILLISNHINAGGGEGAEVIYSLRNDSKLSNLILNNFKKSGFKVRKVYQKPLPSNINKDYYFILRDTKDMNSIIVEYGFIDNKEDLDNIKKNYKGYVRDVVDAVLSYYNINKGTYIVKKGDTLYSISKKFNIPLENLKNINKLNSNLIHVGDTLIINPSSYKVEKGDTLYSISKKFNTTVDKLKIINNKENSLIKEGEVLIIN